MPTYLNNYPMNSSQDNPVESINCRQIYEHVQDCPVCQQLFNSSLKNPIYETTPKKTLFSINEPIQISPTIIFFIIIIIIVLVLYNLRNFKK